uniref:Dynein light chain n=1 Tax=Steinernema glaseri TaxID=37863 RepID=A0A1I8AT37_9BILA
MADEIEDLGIVKFGEREEDDGAEAPSFEKLADDSETPTLDPEVALQNILDCVLPPRRFEESEKLWIEHASTLPATRLDVLALKERFEKTLECRGAKAFGICPIRRCAYDQLFDELIRQVTVNCVERGVLLLRVRDELRFTLLSYQSLLESAVAYGVRKAITVERQQTRAVVERDEEIARNKQLSLKLEELEQRLASERLANEEEIDLLEQRMKDENARLAEANKALKAQLQTILQLEESNKVEDVKEES